MNIFKKIGNGFLNLIGDLDDNKKITIDPFVFLKVLKYFKRKDEFIELFRPFYKNKK